MGLNIPSVTKDNKKLNTVSSEHCFLMHIIAGVHITCLISNLKEAHTLM